VENDIFWTLSLTQCIAVL